jgi:two-component system, chemotaxis family, CheB/CheR fusion protein
VSDQSSNRNSSQIDFHIIGIGASAGGLEAIENFFDNIPGGLNMAFVIVQHLSPDYKSLMGELLSKHTAMTIFQAEDGMEIVPGAVYLIPRKKNMTVFNGKLFLTQQEQGLNLPIDIFLQSLAEDAGEKSVAVILSGTGSDGTRGVRAIKEAGGIVMVQDEESAKFDGMPRSALATGIVDYVLPPNQLAEELQNFVKGNITLKRDDPTRELTASNTLSKIFLLIKRKTGVDLSFYKESTILRRIERRMGINQTNDIRKHVELMERSPGEIQSLFKEILIGVTKFFRDQEAFWILKEQVIPAIFEKKANGEEVRVWVAGCSTGEEAYSLAILLADYVEEHKLSNDVKIFATDIDKGAIDFASYGIYPESIAADADMEHLQRYFVKKGESYQVVQKIREMVIFAYHNIFKDPPFRRTDLISCRNLLIYLQPVLQKRVLSNFHFSLTDGGFLFLGSSETVADFSKYFQNIDVKWKIFQFRGGGTTPHIEIDGAEAGWRRRLHETSRRVEITQQSHPRFEQVYEQLIEAALPPCVIIDESWEIRHVFGDVSPFLRLPVGKVDLNVSRMAKGDLSIPLGTAIQSAAAEKIPVSLENVMIPESETGKSVRLTVRPIRGGFDAYFFAITFEETGQESVSQAITRFDLEESVRTRIKDLENELQHSRENLQATIEELETSNEELQATNEELLSSNEELQSTNEELQSVNEELITVNSEYQKKIEELSELNDDMTNLLAGTEVGTVFLDTELTIRKYTPPVTRQINLIKSDIGRPFSDLTTNLQYDSLVRDIREVLQSLRPREIEVPSTQDRWYLVKITPYRTETAQVRGVVVTLIDITERRTAEAALSRQHDLFMRILDSNPTAITMVDRLGRIVYANQKAEAILRLKESGKKEMSYDDPLFNITDPEGKPIPSEELPFAHISSSGEPVSDYVHCITHPNGETVTLRINGSPIVDEYGEVEGAVFNVEEMRES